MKSTHSFAEKYAAGILVVASLMLTGTLFTIEKYDLVPLQGQATPMYGSMQTGAASSRSTLRVRKPVQKKSSRSSRRSTRLTRVSSSSSSSVSR